MQFLLTQEEHARLIADRACFDKEVKAQVDAQIEAYRERVSERMTACIKRHFRSGDFSYGPSASFLSDLKLTWVESRHEDHKNL